MDSLFTGEFRFIDKSGNTAFTITTEKAHAEICYAHIEEAIKEADDIICRLDRTFQTEEDVKSQTEFAEFSHKMAKKGFSWPNVFLPPGHNCFNILLPFCEQAFKTRGVAGDEINSPEFAERKQRLIPLLRSKLDELANKLSEKLPEETSPNLLKLAIRDLTNLFESRFIFGDSGVDVRMYQDRYENYVLQIATVSAALGRKYGHAAIDSEALIDGAEKARNPFVWNEKVDILYNELGKAIGDAPEKWTIRDHIAYVGYCCLDYYHTVIEWIPYLRGDTDDRPALKKCGDGAERNVGDWVVATILPTVLASVHLIIKNLPQLNRPGVAYPIDKLDQMFSLVNLLLFAMNHCEEESKSIEGSYLGLAAARNLKLRNLVCPQAQSGGRIVLEGKLIAQAYEEFHMSICNAAHALADKVKKRESGIIDVEMPMPDSLEAAQPKGKPCPDADPLRDEEASAAVCYYHIEEALASIDEIIRLLGKPSPIHYKIDRKKLRKTKEKFGPGERKVLDEIARKYENGITWADLILPTGDFCDKVLIPFEERFFEDRRLAGEEVNNPKFTDQRAHDLPMLRSKLDDLASKLLAMLPGDPSPIEMKVALGEFFNLFNSRFLYGDTSVDIAEYKAKFQNFRGVLTRIAAALSVAANKAQEEPAHPQENGNSEILSRLDDLKAGQKEIKVGQTEVKEGVSELKDGQEEIKTNQGKVFDVLDLIKGFFPKLFSRLRTIQKTVDGDHTKITEKTRANETRVEKAVGLTYILINKGTKRRNATTDACREIEQDMGLGDYANFETFRNAVARIIAENEEHYGDKAAKVYFEEHPNARMK